MGFFEQQDKDHKMLSDIELAWKGDEAARKCLEGNLLDDPLIKQNQEAARATL